VRYGVAAKCIGSTWDIQIVRSPMHTPAATAASLPAIVHLDIPLLGAGGLAVRLFQLLRGSHWSVIRKDMSDEARPPVRAGLDIHHTGRRGDIADVRIDLTSLYGLAKGESVLIRPDEVASYIAFGE
jgi:hypothetical protein